MAREYTGKDIQSIKNDRDRVRKRPSMFIVNTGVEGAIHIAIEIVDNSIDELSIDGSVGDTLSMTFDTVTKEMTIIDDGRGIPHDKLLDVYTVLNTSGKFDNDEGTAYSFSGGTFGVGCKTATFLSKALEVTSMRDGKYITYIFKDGLLVDTKTGKSKEHGTITKFTIDQKIIDINGVTANDIKDRLYEKSFLFPNLKINYIILENGKEIKSHTFFGNTLMDMVKKWKPDTDIVHITDTRKVKVLKNIDDDDVTSETVIVDVALAFKEAALDADTDTFVISYANSIKTYDGGQHVEGMKAGIIKYMKEVAMPKFTKKDADLPIMPSDMTAGLCAYVSVKLFRPEYSAQHKSRLTNQEVRFAVRDAVFEALCNQKSSVTNAMIDFIKRVTRGRMASKKSRKKDVGNAFSKERLDKYKEILYNMDTTHPEILLVEGDSAAGNASISRDPHNQAIYPIKKPKNIFDSTTEQVNLVKTVFNDIMDICGIEPGKKCDPSKSVMSKILLLTDGDVDGDNIAISTVCLLAKHCKPMIDAGMVGRILPPAYSFPTGKGDKKKFIRSKREFLELIMQKFIKEVTVTHNGKEFKKNDLYDFMIKNFSYDEKLEELASRYCVDPKFMEYIAWKYHDNAEDQKKSYWTNALKKYNQLRVLTENGSIVIDGEVPGSDYINFAFDEYFDRHVKRFKEYQKINTSIDGFAINGEGDKTLYDVMHMFRKYTPKNIVRFKGLGELDPEDMKELCMDPKKRKVVIFKFKDFDKDMLRMNVIMSTKAEYVAARTKILSSLRIDNEDLDT